MSDAAAFAGGYKLNAAQHDVLTRLDVPGIVAMGAHPLVPFLANMQIERLRREAKAT